MSLQQNPEIPAADYPEGDALQSYIARRNFWGRVWRLIFQLSTIVGIIALAALLYNIINGAFGYVAMQNKIDPEALVLAVNEASMPEAPNTVASRTLQELPPEALITILEENLSSGLLRRFESEEPLTERSQEELYRLVVDRVVQPTVKQSWTLVDSFTKREEIEAEVEKLPNGSLEFRAWLTEDFITGPQSSDPQDAGVRTALLGSLWIIAITIAFAFPIGLGAAIYLEEYASQVANPLLRRFNEIIQTNINNLAGVPSIIYGMLGLAIFVRGLESITSGALFGLSDPATANGRTLLSAGLTMGLLILPLLIINAQEAIRAVPSSLRQASLGLGATKWQTIWAHVLPNALPGILTGTILSISRAIGETAPLIVIGASTFIVTDPNSPFSKFTALPIQIYQWTARPQAEFRNIAAAASIVLLVLLLLLNASAIVLRNRYSKRRLA